MKFTYKGKYPKKVVMKVMNLLQKNMDIRSIVELTGVPETTITNWKFGYTRLYGTKPKFDYELKQKILNLISEGYSIPRIAQELKIGYDDVRLFLKRNISSKKYDQIKVLNRMLPNKSKELTPELAYILGVLYGDGYFGPGQIRLGTKDKDFADYFILIVEKWCGKKPLQTIRSMNNKPYFESYLAFKNAANLIKTIVGDRTSIPKIITISKNEAIIQMFVKGFSDSEGTFVINSEGRMNSIKMYNQKFLVLEQIKKMMVRIGFNFEKLAIVVNNKAKNGDVYAIRMCSQDQVKLFYNKVGFTIQRKQKKLKNYLKMKELL